VVDGSRDVEGFLELVWLEMVSPLALLEFATIDSPNTVAKPAKMLINHEFLGDSVIRC
jgi:hypothetical protein